MADHLQFNLLQNTFAVRHGRRHRHKTTSQLALFPGRETLGRLLLAGRPVGPLGGPFTLRVQGRPPQPSLSGDARDGTTPDVRRHDRTEGTALHTPQRREDR